MHPDDLLAPDADPLAPAAERVRAATDRRWRMADGSWRWLAHRTQAMGGQTLHVLRATLNGQWIDATSGPSELGFTTLHPLS